MTAGATAWLTIVGVGEDGAAGLGERAKAAIAGAALVVGGARHLMLVGPFDGEALAWPSPIDAAYPEILARRGTPVAVLASGDPFHFGIGSVLARLVPPEEMVALPAPSAFSLAAARLGWALQDCDAVSIHGRDFATIRRHLQPGRRLLVLTSDGRAPAALADELVDRGMGRSRLTVLEAMGGPRERVLSGTAEELSGIVAGPLNTVAIEVVADAERAMPLVPGRPDDWFENDGQITRPEIRAMTLAALAPRAGELLWDVGGGSGAVAVEWMLAHSANRAVSVEVRADRAARIRANAATLGVPGLVVVEGRAPDALAGLPTPDAAFVGGGLGEPGVVNAVWDALRPGGRLVANAVTLETQALVFGRHAALGGSLTEVRLSHAAPVGPFRAMRPALTVVQWSVRRPR